MNTKMNTRIALTMRIALTTTIVGTTLIGTRAAAQSGQDIAARVRNAPDGKVRFTFQSRPDVCSWGNGVSTHSDNTSANRSDRSEWNYGGTSPDVEWDSGCEHGPVRMVIDVDNHAVTGLRSYVGGRWRPASNGVTDLGAVPSRAAADYLLSIAQTSPGAVANKAIFPATLADSAVIWPTLLAIARNEQLARQTRRDAVFWLGQIAGDAATANLSQLVANDTIDRGVRESAVFALSQRPRDEGVPALIQVAQTNKDPDIRRKALFWLGQSNDPRALQLFEKLLTVSQ